MGHKSKFNKKLEFTSKKNNLLEFQSKRTPLIEKESEFARTMVFQSRWITEEVGA